MKDRERMIARLKAEIKECEHMEKTGGKDCAEVRLLMIGARSALEAVLGWYNEIGADGKPVFRK